MFNVPFFLYSKFCVMLVSFMVLQFLTIPIRRGWGRRVKRGQSLLRLELNLELNLGIYRTREGVIREWRAAAVPVPVPVTFWLRTV